MSYDLSAPAALISERMGLHYPEDRWPDLARGLERAAASLGFDSVHSFISHLLDHPFGQREMHALAPHLTINETHFFRTPETFAMLQSRLLPELISAQANTTRRLRIWSAGCATGQEPFSLAILVSRLIPKLDGWDITILGTDIDPEVLAAANEAEYTQWSFRGTPSWVVNGYFTQARDGQYRLDRTIQSMVTFRHLNLVEDLYPLDFDLVVCRNVLMYFSRDVAMRVADRLRSSVREGGYFLVTPSETSREIQGEFSSLMMGGEIVYKKTPIAVASERAEAWTPVQKRSLSDSGTRTSPLRTARRSMDRRVPVAAPQPAMVPVERRGKNRPFVASTEQATERMGPGDAERQARILANKGDLERAFSLCEAALESNKLSPTLHYLEASILQALGRPEEAERALQSTLFLDGTFAPARVMLGAIARGQSRPKEAAKHFQAALSSLERMPSDSVLPETDGLTAGEMAEMVVSLMRNECVL
jgi:chemotaxis protein methyltransferase CheR